MRKVLLCVSEEASMCIRGRAVGLMHCPGGVPAALLLKSPRFLMDWVMWWVELEARSLPSQPPSPACPALPLWNLLSSHPPSCTFHSQRVSQPQDLTCLSSGTDLCDTNCLISMFTLSLSLCSSCLSSKLAPSQPLLCYQKGLSRWIGIPLALPFSSLKHRCSLMPVFFSTTCLSFLFVLVKTESPHYFCVCCLHCMVHCNFLKNSLERYFICFQFILLVILYFLLAVAIE